METVVLAIDQGTTGTTVIAFNKKEEIIARGYAEFPQIYPKPGWVEHDPEVIWTTTEKVIAEVIARCGPVAAIGITNQRETTVIWDRASGRPIYNAIVWQCRRTADLCGQLAHAEPLFRQRTGLVLDAYFSGTKIRWLLDNVPGARARAEAGELCFGTIDSWLIWKLTGGKQHLTDFTNASRTLLFDIGKQGWDPELCDLLQVPTSLLPRVVPSSGVLAHTDSKSVFCRAIPIAGIAGDQQAALYGQRCTQPGQVKNTYGTGCFLMQFTGDNQRQSKHGLLTTLACHEDGSPGYALEGSVFIGGAAVQWLRDQLGLINHAEETEAIATSLDGNGGVYLVPAFAGLGAPYWDMDARGTLTGLTRGTGRAHIVRAALESIAYQSRDVLEAMNNDTGLDIPELRVDGGASNNAFLMQFQADQLSIPILCGSHAEMTAFGAALLAGRALDFWQGSADTMTTGKRYEPQGGHERDALYAGWKKAVQATCSDKP